MEKQVLDYVLVPTGLLILAAYHIWLLYHIINHPTRTVVGLNAINRRFWVRAMMEDVAKYGVLAVQSLRNTIMASTLLASTAILLCSLIAILMTSSPANRSTWFIYGDESSVGYSVKFFSILVCFLVAFLMTVQSVRYYSHASILINVPHKKIASNYDQTHKKYCHVTPEYVGRTVNRGSYFWSLGLRSFYFSFPLFLWIFGPIPMFVCCLLLVFFLYFLDVIFDFGWVVRPAESEDEDNQIHGDVEAN